MLSLTNIAGHDMLTIALLRDLAPDWTWKAERAGMGWEYRGKRGEESVRVFAVAQLISHSDIGYDDENFRTCWMVDVGTYHEPFWMWPGVKRFGT